MSLPQEFVNRFICGDCFEQLRSLPDGCVDLVLTDPPYGIDYQSNRRVSRPKLPQFENDIDLSWVDGWVDEVHRVLKDDRHFYCFTRYDMYPVFYNSISRKFKVKNCLIWVKNNHGSGDLNGSYAPQYEMIIFAVKGKRHLNGSRDSDVLGGMNVPSAHRYHATQKPVDVLRQLIEKSTEPDEIVLDPFAGVGSTGLACLMTSGKGSDGQLRRYLLFELNPDFVEKGRKGGLGRQEVLLDVRHEDRRDIPAKQRPAARTYRVRAKEDRTLAFDFRF
jgi:site-specific DNA-methyltransferase (adenine-specific)